MQNHPSGPKETCISQSQRLNPVTSLSTSRYNRSCYVQVCPRIISRGPAPRGRSVQHQINLATRLAADRPPQPSTPSAPRWRRFIHPEGQPYSVLNNEEFAVVTEANLEDAETEQAILGYVKLVQKELQCHDIKVPPSVQVCPRIISRGPAPRGRSVQHQINLATRLAADRPPQPSTPSAPRWRRFIHPEGQPYSVLNNEEFAVVTEANLEDAETEQAILGYVKLVQKELQCHDIKVPPRCELFLELEDDRTQCNYYFVDHAAKGLFWLEELGTESLDISAAMSPSHLEGGLERLYWVHVEFFPMHHESHEEFSQIVEDLCNIISHGQAGKRKHRLTSRTSTFPYTAETCKQFLKLLARKRGQRVDGYTLCYAARLAGAIANQRFITFYGQQSAQLDRLQEMYPDDILEHKWVSTPANWILWGIPRHYSTLLEDLYVNEQVYADQWTNFMSLCLADWTSSLAWTFPVLIVSILLASVRGGTISTAIPTVLASTISIASASCLHLRHHSLADTSASIGARYLRSAKSDTFGFLPSAVVFSLPRAGYMWGVGFLIAQFLFITSRSINKLVALVAASVLAILLVFILWVISPEEMGIASFFRNFASSCFPRFNGVEKAAPVPSSSQELWGGGAWVTAPPRTLAPRLTRR
ncbi:hypothetical protein PAXINDRAFT_15450 [Paxillus involutus ATCC 200175]|uniref:Uncharacterized protein n=1 Tax=Paxillus involutus ATCC 200175 TaxID=664439 RepID=A0A0C9ST26_PAXIN|nr:hypothetical protein PAXINDRAFT_15450 [Paxillus involutus ATCC 200175]